MLVIIIHAFSSPVLGLLPRLSLNVLDFIPDPLTRLTVVPGSIFKLQRHPGYLCVGADLKERLDASDEGLAESNSLTRE